ncbi:MAG: inorganic diphosphatase, partial [Proteobacteria bacterium]|nr:inorganic diphosphatase [Pseudomonadota bacterium]
MDTTQTQSKVNMLVAHPWHGIEPYPKGAKEQNGMSPDKVCGFIEMTPSSDVKCEIDKVSGHLSIDRPQKYTNFLPCLYGFIPQTYCHTQVTRFACDAFKEQGLVPPDSLAGDHDPLDICVLTDRSPQMANMIV